jgi:putative ABC transport system substrate-binding protein
LNETGFIEGRNVTVEFRFAYNDNARLPELVGDLVQRRVAVIATPASTPAALAAKAATATVPIVLVSGQTRSKSVWLPASIVPAATSLASAQ